MTTSDASTTGLSSGEEDLSLCFSEWLKQRRQELDLTQEQLAKHASCSVFAIRKIESGERRPSQQLARILAGALEIPCQDQDVFIKAARGELSMERLASLGRISSRVSQPVVNSSSLSSNLPRALTPFIGREPELYSLGQLLCDPQCSLLTILGHGGIGKTRLAIEAANQYKDRFPDGVWFVPLAALNSPALLVPAIADGVNYKIQGPTNPQTQLLQHLCEKRTLLILDNAEHLLDGVGVFAEILKHCSQVKLIVTSRERLNLYGEWVFETLGLPVPPNDQAEQFESFSSVALFLQSARRALPGLRLDETDRAAVVDICRLVEGMPLAIELAATWIRTLSTAEIAAEIKHSLDFLSTSAQDVPERHRSMRAVFDHSWEMLSVEEQQVLCQLSVFRGGFNRQAAEQVAGASLSILSTLVNRTLVRLSQAQLRETTVRYNLHDLIRQYCADHLLENPDVYVAVQKQHCAYFLALAETADQELRGPNQLEWLNRLDQELGNLRAALEWSLKSAAQGTDEPALRLSGALRWFWRMRGHFYEGHNWLIETLRQSSERSIAGRASALLGMSLILNGLGDLGAARPLAEESATIYRKLNDQRGLAEALTLTGLTLAWQGEVNLGQARLEEALAICRGAGNRWGEAQALYRLGSFLADYAGNPTGRATLEESVAILEDLGEKYVLASVLISLGIVDVGLGDYAAARARFEHGLAIAREIKHPWGMADALTNLGCVCRILGEYSTAQSHFEKALQVYREHGRSIWEIDVLCALAENAISQGDLATARFCLQAASDLLETSENKWLQTLVSYFRGLLAHYEGDAVAAMRLLEETTVLAREGQYKPDLARSLVALGHVIRSQGDDKQAVIWMRESLDLYHRLGQKLGMAISLERIAGWASEEDAWQAAKLFGVAEAIREAIGAPLPPVDRSPYENDVARTRAQLGEAVLARAWAKGKAMSLEEAIDFALSLTTIRS